MDLIDIRQLRAFQLLAETGSFTGAGKKMFLTQSAISHSTKALESSLGCRLIERGGKNITLTPEGEILLRRANRILTEMQKATSDLEALSKWGYSRLRIGATDTMCVYLIPQALREFKEKSPNCDIAIQSADSHDLLEMLEAGEIDIAVGMATSGDSASLKFTPLFTDRIVFVVSPDHPWAASGIAAEEDLHMQRYIIYNRKSRTFRLIKKHFPKLGIGMSSMMELGNMEAIKELSKIGLGVGVVSPWLASSDIAEGTLVQVEIPGDPINREWGLFSHKSGNNAGLPEEMFAGICKKIAAEFC